MEALRATDPATLGPYRLLGRLGTGGMGQVYLARSAGGRTVAVKVIRADLAHAPEDPDFRRRFEHEVRSAGSVPGRFTVPVIDADTGAETPWLVTSFVPGPSLDDVVRAHGPLPVRTVRALGAGLAAAVREIHAAGLVHRDLKPSNVLLAADGPRVIDFGIARAVGGDRLTQTGVVVGSPGYMPPEHVTGQEAGGAGDLFSLGAVLAYAAGGRHAFGDEGAGLPALLFKVAYEEPELSAVPPELAGLIAACLAKAPADRPAAERIAAELGGTDGAFTDWLPGAVASTIASYASRILDLDTPVRADSRTTPLRASGTAPAPGADGAAAAGPAPSPPRTQADHPPRPATERTEAAGPAAAGKETEGAEADRTEAAATRSAHAPDAHAPHEAPTADRPLPRAAKGEDKDKGEGAPSRRRFLGIAAAVTGVAAIGGGAAWVAASDDPPSGGGGGDKSGGGPKGPYAPDKAADFATPPDGKAPKPLWHRKLGKASISDLRPVVVGERVLISGPTFRALNVRTGQLVWERKKLQDTEGAGGIVHQGHMVFAGSGDYDGSVVGLDTKTGTETWRARLGGELSARLPVAADAERLYVVADIESGGDDGDARNALVAIDRKTREKVWRENRDEGTEGGGFTTALGPHHLVYADFRRNVTVRDTRTGKQLWTRKLGQYQSPERPLVHGKSLIIAGKQLRAYDLDTGTPRWTLKPEGRGGFRAPAVLGGVLYVFDDERGVWAVDPANGRKRWMREDFKGRSFADEWVLARGRIYAASVFDRDGIYALDPKTGASRWMFDDRLAESTGWHLAVAGPRLLVAHGYQVYALPAA